MSKHKTSELTGPLLDWAAEMAGKTGLSRYDALRILMLIDKYEIALTPDQGGDHWTAWATNPDDESDTRHMGEGETAQIAICRAVVRSVFGDEIELPE